MTVGALYQIKSYSSNSENNFLEYDPQISFFKAVYRKYTRFAMENIKFDNLSRNTLSYDSNVIITSNVPRNGDLLKNIYLTFELPDIYSGSYTNNKKKEIYEFNWIKNIGTNIFNYVKLKINDQDIFKLYSDYLNIWKELHLTDEEKQVYNENIGHVKELYDPKNGMGQNGKYPNITKAAKITGSETDESVQSRRWLNHDPQIINFSEKNDKTFPSILGRKIKVPLPFHFCSNSGLVLPLIALQYSIISLEFEMKQFRDLYTIIDPKFESSSSSFGKRIKPSSDSHHKMNNFTTDYNFNIKPNIEGEYIFLDKDERKRFALFDHEYFYECFYEYSLIDPLHIF